MGCSGSLSEDGTLPAPGATAPACATVAPVTRATPYVSVAACIEGAPADAAVIREATRLVGDGRLTVVHVAQLPTQLGDTTDASLIGLGVALDPAPFLAAARERLATAAASAPKAELVLLDGGEPAPAVCTWAADAGVDLLVAGAHRGRMERFALGSFAGFVAHHAPCPVLLVRPI